MDDTVPAAHRTQRSTSPRAAPPRARHPVATPPPTFQHCAYAGCGLRELCTAHVKQRREAEGAHRSGFKVCARCRRARYCSEACQLRAWAGHMATCDAFVEAASTAAAAAVVPQPEGTNLAFADAD